MMLGRSRRRSTPLHLVNGGGHYEEVLLPGIWEVYLVVVAGGDRSLRPAWVFSGLGVHGDHLAFQDLLTALGPKRLWAAIDEVDLPDGLLEVADIFAWYLCVVVFVVVTLASNFLPHQVTNNIMYVHNLRFWGVFAKTENVPHQLAKWIGRK